jgi:hypothetical protein
MITHTPPVTNNNFPVKLFGGYAINGQQLLSVHMHTDKAKKSPKWSLFPWLVTLLL